MIKLEIKILPKDIKYLEFSQSLLSIKTDLKQLCSSFEISEQNRSFSIIANLNSPEQLTKILYSKELRILSGAIRLMGESSEISIQGPGYNKRGTDLSEIRLNYLKTEKEIN